jgi:hypothetical protein
MPSRRMTPPPRDRREPGSPGRPAPTVWLLAGLVLSLVLGLSGCGAGGGSESATRPHHRTLRHPPCPEPDRVAERDDHGTDATNPDERGHANLGPNSDLG